MAAMVGRARRAVGRLAARVASRREHGGADAPGRSARVDQGPALPEDRLQASLVVVAEAERQEPALPSTTEPVLLWTRDRVARRPELSALLADLVPPQLRSGWTEGSPEVTVASAPVAADLVVTAKFDIDGLPKLRAAYAQEMLTLAAQPANVHNGVDGIARTVAAHRVMEQHAPHLIPPLVAHGTLPVGLPYVVERWVPGTQVATGAGLAQAAPAILAGLADVHRGHGVGHRRVADLHDRLGERWEQTRRTGIVPDDLGRWVSGLLERQATVRTSWVHGDLAASNVLRTDAGFVLLDWEHSHEGAIMHDAAKLHLFSSDPDATLAAALEAFRGAGATTSAHSSPEELALAHAQLISHYPERSARLAGHRRGPVYQRQIERQVQRLQAVRDAAG